MRGTFVSGRAGGPWIPGESTAVPILTHAAFRRVKQRDSSPPHSPSVRGADGNRTRPGSDLREVRDLRVRQFDETMIVSGGRRGLSVELSPLDLVELTDAEVTDLAQV